MSSNLPKPKTSVLLIKPYKQGESTLMEGQKKAIALSANEGALGASPKAFEAIAAMQEKLHKYPDGGAKALREAIGKHYNLDPCRIVCGAGSDELISLLIQAYAREGDEVLYSQYGFSMYRISALAHGAVPISVPEKNYKADVDALLAAVNQKTKIIFLANPNNPTGSYLNTGELLRLHTGLRRNVLLVIDAAYSEYATNIPDYSQGHALTDRHENVVVTHTFSKLYGLAALRLGWCYAPAHVIDMLNRVRGPFNVSQVAQEAGIAALEDYEHIKQNLAINAEEIFRVRKALIAMGLEILPSAGNFLLLNFAQLKRKSAIEADAYLRKKGLILRRMDSYGLSNSLRLTIAQRPMMDACLTALEEYLSL